VRKGSEAPILETGGKELAGTAQSQDFARATGSDGRLNGRFGDKA